MTETKRFRLPLNLQLFAEGSGEGHDEEKGEGTPGDPEKTFTQAEVDEVVAKRLARERKGREDYDDIKTKLAEYEAEKAEREKAAMTEAERLQAEKEDAVRKAQEAEERGNTALKTANDRLITAEFKALARENNVPADRLDAALKLADLSGMSVDEAGTVEGVADAVKALLAANPYLAEQPKPKPIGGRQGDDGSSGDKTKEELLAAAAAKAKANPTPQNIAQFTKLKRELNA